MIPRACFRPVETGAGTLFSRCIISVGQVAAPPRISPVFTGRAAPANSARSAGYRPLENGEREPISKIHNRLIAALSSVIKRGAVGLTLALLPLSVALADPCKAIPDRGPMPAQLAPGSRFAGAVVYVGDGDSLCVAIGQRPAAWVEVRLADFYAPELSAPGGRQAKAALERIAMGQRVECFAQHRSHDRVVAVCTALGVSLGDRMRANRVSEGGNGHALGTRSGAR